jgi:hypothetical protein
MQSEGTLVLFAELSVAFAGFTGVVGVLNRRVADEAAASQELRLLIEYSVSTLIRSLLPLVLWNMGLSELSAWRVASAFWIIQSAAYHWFRFSAVHASFPPESRFIFWISIVADWATWVGLALGAANVLPWSPAPLYLLALLWNLVGTALSFIRLVQPLWRGNGTTDA